MTTIEIRERAMMYALQAHRPGEHTDDDLLKRAETIRLFLDPPKTPISKAPPVAYADDDI